MINFYADPVNYVIFYVESLNMFIHRLGPDTQPIKFLKLVCQVNLLR